MANHLLSIIFLFNFKNLKLTLPFPSEIILAFRVCQGISNLLFQLEYFLCFPPRQDMLNAARGKEPSERTKSE